MNAGLNARDRRICFLLSKDFGFKEISDIIGIAPQSVFGRVQKLKAQRWLTASGRPLSPQQREAALAWERDSFGLVGKIA